MKYSIAEYTRMMEEFPIWEPSEDSTNYLFCISKVKKEHYCYGSLAHKDKKLINVWDIALVEKCIFPDVGRQTAYTCTFCMDKWIDQHKEFLK